MADSHDYDEDIRAMDWKGKDAAAIYETLSQRDVQTPPTSSGLSTKD